jgi:4-hydroxybenzoate polyprenyltransferase
VNAPDSPVSPAAPLVIDLDGTLLRTNALFECLLIYLKQNPVGALRLPLWLAGGRANLKRQLGSRAPLSPATLPLNEAIHAYAVSEKAKGREVWLATAADSAIAETIAERCQCFDGVLASDGQTNLKGHHKAERLGTMFASGFAYAGDSMADLPVWSRASEVIVVGGSSWTREAALNLRKPTQIIPAPSRLRALLKCARPHQWAKNLLVFVPAILGGAIADPQALLTTIVCFIALCFVASSTYILNDLWDLADDRQHWSKRFRPIASGALPIASAMTAAPLGLAAGLALGLAVAPAAFAVLCAYLGFTLAYTYRIKRIPVLDVTTLAGLFTLRLVLGIVSSGVFASPWLLTFSMFLFASLCFAKRYVEVEGAAARGQSVIGNRGYQIEDTPLLIGLGLGTGTAAIVIMVLYIIFDAFQRSFYGNPIWLWAFPVILFLWVSRLWLMALRKALDDDPVAFAVRDRPSLMLGGTLVASFILAWSGVFA